jgi:hypothetical protein
MIINQYEINGVYFTECINYDGQVHYEAVMINCTGFGSTAKNALEDLEGKLKSKLCNKILKEV